MDYVLFGASHARVVGVLLRCVPPGLPVDFAAMKEDLKRRAGGKAGTTPRRETDEVEILSGVFEGKTTGDPVCLILRNQNVNAAPYEALRYVARPGHADYTGYLHANGCNDYRGGGSFSGRMTAPLVAAGSLAKQVLKLQDIEVKAQIIDENDLRQRAKAASEQGDSVGGRIRCTVTGVPASVGGNDWRCAVESEIARHVFAIPAVKAIGFGAGEEFAALRGSAGNDAFRTDGEKIWTTTNRAGGINGGITNGMPVEFTVTFRPTPSIAKEQETVNFHTMKNTTISVAGRHDPCIALRAAPAVEAAAALALCHLMDADADDLEACRRAVDEIDDEMTALFEKRLALVEKIGQYKKENLLPVLDAARQEAVLERSVLHLRDKKWTAQTRELFEKVMEISRNTEG